MSITNIFIARHGETEYNRLKRLQGRGIDASLNATGRAQARALAGCLRPEAIDLVISSSLKRSRETARIIADDFNQKVHAFPELDEMDFGSLEGRPSDEIAGQLEELHRQWLNGNVHFALPNGESPADVLQRVLRRMELLLEEHHSSNILFILHGRLIRILLSEWLGYGLAEMHRIEHCNGALYHIRMLEDGAFTPVYLKRTDHLH